MNDRRPARRVVEAVRPEVGAVTSAATNGSERPLVVLMRGSRAPARPPAPSGWRARVTCARPSTRRSGAVSGATASTTRATTPRSSQVDAPAAHLFKHPRLGVEDVEEVWADEPLFHPATPPAHWLMVTEVAGRVLTVPLAPSRSGDLRRCRPIGCYVAAEHVARRYLDDR